MKRVEVAIEVHCHDFPSQLLPENKNFLIKVDSAATKELATEVEAVRNDNRVKKVFPNSKPRQFFLSNLEALSHICPPERLPGWFSQWVG